MKQFTDKELELIIYSEMSSPLEVSQALTIKHIYDAVARRLSEMDSELDSIPSESGTRRLMVEGMMAEMRTLHSELRGTYGPGFVVSKKDLPVV